MRLSWIRWGISCLVPVLIAETCFPSVTLFSVAPTSGFSRYANTGSLYSAEALAERPGAIRFIPSFSRAFEARTLAGLQGSLWTERQRRWVGLSFAMTAALSSIVWMIVHPESVVKLMPLASALLGMTLRLSTDHDPKLNETQTSKPELRQTLIDSSLGAHVREEHFLIRLWEIAFREHRIRTIRLSNPSVTFRYALVNGDDLTAVEKGMYRALIEKKGPTFSHPLFDDWPEPFDDEHPVMARGQGLVFVEDGVFGSYNNNAAVHELAEMMSAKSQQNLDPTLQELITLASKDFPKAEVARLRSEFPWSREAREILKKNRAAEAKTPEPHSTKTIEQQLEQLKYSQSEIKRIEAVQWLGEMANHVGVLERIEIVSALCVALAGVKAEQTRQDALSAVREASLAALSKIISLKEDSGYATKESEDPFVSLSAALTNDDDFNVRIDAAYVLMRVAPDAYAGEIAAQLRESSSSEQKEFNRAILRILSDRTNFFTSEDTAVAESLKAYQEEETDPVLRAMAKEVLRRFEDNPTWFEYVQKRWEHDLSAESSPAAWSRPILIGQTVKIVGPKSAQRRNRGNTGLQGIVTEFVNGKVRVVKRTGKSIDLEPEDLEIISQPLEVFNTVENIHNQQNSERWPLGAFRTADEAAKALLTAFGLDNIDSHIGQNVRAELALRLVQRPDHRWVMKKLKPPHDSRATRPVTDKTTTKFMTQAKTNRFLFDGAAGEFRKEVLQFIKAILDDDLDQLWDPPANSRPRRDQFSANKFLTLLIDGYVDQVNDYLQVNRHFLDPSFEDIFKTLQNIFAGVLNSHSHKTETSA